VNNGIIRNYLSIFVWWLFTYACGKVRFHLELNLQGVGILKENWPVL
jgi:hypothetical protein